MAKKDAEMRDDSEILDEGSGPRVYELGFHLDPELPTEEVKKAYQGMHSVIEDIGTIVAEGEPQMVQLAYTISRQEQAGRRDFNSAQFAWIAYECDASKHADVLTAAKADARIFRFIDLITDKEEARHAAEMQELSLKASMPRAEAEETVSDTELDAALESATL